MELMLIILLIVIGIVLHKRGVFRVLARRYNLKNIAIILAIFILCIAMLGSCSGCFGGSEDEDDYSYSKNSDSYSSGSSYSSSSSSSGSSSYRGYSSSDDDLEAGVYSDGDATYLTDGKGNTFAQDSDGTTYLFNEDGSALATDNKGNAVLDSDGDGNADLYTKDGGETWSEVD